MSGRDEQDGRRDDPGAGPTVDGIDPALAAERTDLAWSRSGLSLVVCGVAVLKALPGVVGADSEPLAGAVLVVLGASAWLLDLAYRRRRWGERGRRPRPTRYRDLAPVAFGTAAIGVVGVVVVLLESA